MAFAPEYVAHVLDENFEDAKALFLEPLVAIDYAHLVMLVEQGIVEREPARRVRDAIDALPLDTIRSARYDGSCEDLFFYVEREIAARAGEDAAGRLHTARSRNDIDMTMYRMRQREFVLGLLRASLALREALLGVAAEQRETVFAAHTHTQPAQPTTVAHYLLAIVEQLERDARRLEAAFASTNRSPLGACAITGTGFPIDRRLTADLLGFDEPTGNTYGSIATVDYLLESLSAAATFLVGLGRFVQDMLLWCTAEFGYLRLPEGFVQCSSIMPQKRNPVALEHARALGSKALGQALGVFSAVHNTPFGDIVDTEDDLQPLVFRAFRDAIRAATLVAAAMRGAQFDAPRMARRASEGLITVTELADTLARDHGLSFRAGHAIAARLVQARAAGAAGSLAEALARASQEVLGAPLEYTEGALESILSPRHFVEVRRTAGGPAPGETTRALERSRAAHASDQRWLDEKIGRLRQAQEELSRRAAAL
ncbi:MAG TPA: argininosuccinate lyase [Vicinamibacterales bacterium]|nr:argininosuccinate lyase [Vicinamibacterales bacterium]